MPLSAGEIPGGGEGVAELGAVGACRRGVRASASIVERRRSRGRRQASGVSPFQRARELLHERHHRRVGGVWREVRRVVGARRRRRRRSRGASRDFPAVAAEERHA
jgi:hypothetical protein